MARVTVAAEIDAKVRQQIEIAAASSDKTVSEWVEQALIHELARERDTPKDAPIIMPVPGRMPQGSRTPVRLRGGGTMADTVIRDRERE